MGNVQNMFSGASCSGSGMVGVLGAVDGLLAMSGLSGQNNPFFKIDDGSDEVADMQQKIQEEMRETETTLGNVMMSVIDKLNEATQWSLNNLQAQQKPIDLKQDDDIELNQIFIMGLVAALLILFVYDVIA